MSLIAHVLVLITLLAITPVAFAADDLDQYPSHTLRNDKLSVVVYLPDAQRGFYRSTRFDWSGMFGRAEYKGHRFYALWKSPHNPLDFEDVIGPAEEFGTQRPLGFDQARPGETFIKIGVGHLLKGNDEAYSFFKQYPISKAGDWEVEKAADQGAIRFRQVLKDDRGYGYEYVKRVGLLKDEPGFTIERELKNTGTRAIATNHYNHNFTMIDDEKIGPGYRLTFPFEVKVSGKEPGRHVEQMKIEGKKLLFTAAIWCLLEGYKGLEDHAITIENTRTGAAVKIIGDYPMTRLAFYGAWTAACPEPFTEFTLQPGEKRQWQSKYVFAVGEGR